MARNRWQQRDPLSWFVICEGQSPKTVSIQITTFEEKGEPKWNRTNIVLFPSLITPYRSAKPAQVKLHVQRGIIRICADVWGP